MEEIAPGAKDDSVGRQEPAGCGCFGQGVLLRQQNRTQKPFHQELQETDEGFG